MTSNGLIINHWYSTDHYLVIFPGSSICNTIWSFICSPSIPFKYSCCWPCAFTICSKIMHRLPPHKNYTGSHLKTWGKVTWEAEHGSSLIQITPQFMSSSVALIQLHDAISGLSIGHEPVPTDPSVHKCYYRDAVRVKQIKRLTRGVVLRLKRRETHS